MIRLTQTPVKLGAWGEIVGRKLSQWEDEGWTKSERLAAAGSVYSARVQRVWR